MRQLISPGDLIVQSVRQYPSQARAYGEIAIWYVLLAMSGWAFEKIVSAITIDKGLRLLANLLFALPSGLIAFALFLAVVDIAARALAGRRAEVGRSISQGAHLLIPGIWITILAGLLTGLGTLALVLPGIWLYFRYRFAIYALVQDDIRGNRALTASAGAVNGQWWGVFFRVILTGIAFYVMGRLALAVCFLLVGAALGEPGLLFRTEIDTSYLPTLQALLAAVIPAAVQALVMPLVIGADLILWNDLRRKA